MAALADRDQKSYTIAACGLFGGYQLSKWVLRVEAGDAEVQLAEPGAYVAAPRNTWRTAMSTRNWVRFSNALITTGKDRTGWAAAALLTLIGAPKDVVLEDYLSSNDYILPAYQDTVDAFVVAGGEPAIPPAILGVKKEYLDAAFEEMETRFGSIENYFSEGLDIDPAQQQALRDLYLGE